MKPLKRVLLLAGILGLILIGGLHIKGDTAYAERLMSTTAGVDLSRIYFSVSTKPEFHERLYARAVNRFTKAGLFLHWSKFDQEGFPVLVLTLDPKPFDELPPGKVMYTQKLELYENVWTERTSTKGRARSVTWSYGLDPLITKQVTIEQLETDLDALVDGFITDYKLANPKSK